MDLKKRIQAFGHAINGILILSKDEVHARFHIIAAIVVVILGIYFKVSQAEWIDLFLCIGLVMSLEAINSALENLTDLVTKEQHPLAKKAKDLGAAGVLLSSIFAAIVGGIIFLPKIF